ncbi:hypothetical protein QQG55_44395 [Brugia pahangi]
MQLLEPKSGVIHIGKIDMTNKSHIYDANKSVMTRSNESHGFEIARKFSAKFTFHKSVNLKSFVGKPNLRLDRF